MTAPGGEPPGDPVSVVRLRPRFDALMGLPDRGDLGPVAKPSREGLHPALASPLDSRPPLVEQVGSAALLLLVHDAEPIGGKRRPRSRACRIEGAGLGR